MAHKAIDIANALIALSEPEVGDIMSNLKLQKLLYYTQGFSLVLHNKPIFDEDLVAWEYGPVVKEVYHAFKEYGAGMIERKAELIDFSDEERALLKEIYEVYGQFSALKLMNMTHEELPWKSTSLNQVISHEKLKSYFSDLVEE